MERDSCSDHAGKDLQRKVNEACESRSNLSDIADESHARQRGGGKIETEKPRYGALRGRAGEAQGYRQTEGELKRRRYTGMERTC